MLFFYCTQRQIVVALCERLGRIPPTLWRSVDHYFEIRIPTKNVTHHGTRQRDIRRCNISDLPRLPVVLAFPSEAVTSAPQSPSPSSGGSRLRQYRANVLHEKYPIFSWTQRMTGSLRCPRGSTCIRPPITMVPMHQQACIPREVA